MAVIWLRCFHFVIVKHRETKAPCDGFVSRMRERFFSFFLKYTNNIKPVPICYVPARSLLLFLPPFFSASHLPLLSLLKRLAGCCHPSLSPSLPPFLHIHFMLNWWIKLSLAQNQSWLALPYSFTLDRNPKEKEAREGERDGGRGVRGIRDWEREKHWDTDKAQSHYMSF